MVTLEQAKAVQESLKGDLVTKTVGNSLRMDDNGHWTVCLLLAEEAPTGTFPTVIDGVSITTDVVGKIQPLTA